MNEFYKDHHVTQMHSNGTTAQETFIAIIPSFLTTCIAVMLNSLFCMFVTNEKKWQFVTEYIFLVLPVILCMTILSNYLMNVIIALVVGAASFVLLIRNIKPSKSLEIDNRNNSSFLTNARSTINILSVIAILAVDFNVFPRHFAKTESFGYSLMDVGVGLFMYSNGIVAAEARRRPNPLIKSIKSSIPLFVLGMIRFLAVKQTDYNVPVSEYGVHWNFFITLAVTKIVCALVVNVVKIQYMFITAIFVIVTHEILLQSGMQEFTLSNAQRDNFITANKEGLASSLGYVSIYLFSVYFGYLLHRKNYGNSKSTSVTFIVYSLSMLSVSVVLQSFFGISRKLANSTYCFWVLFIGIFMTGLYFSLQALLKLLYRGRLRGMYSPLVFEAINYNGLVFFLVGNLLTGLINLTIDTLTVDDRIGLTIILLYMFVNCLTVTVLYYKQYKLKL